MGCDHQHRWEHLPDQGVGLHYRCWGCGTTLVRRVVEIDEQQFHYEVSCATWQQLEIPCRWPSCSPPSPLRRQARDRLQRSLWEMGGYGYARAISRHVHPEE